MVQRLKGHTASYSGSEVDRRSYSKL